MSISLPTTSCHKLTKVGDVFNANLFPMKNATSSEVTIDALAEEWKGYVIWINAGNDKQGFFMKQRVWPMAEYICFWVRGILVIDQRDLGRGITSLFEDVLCKPKCSQLGYCKRKEEGCSLTHRFHCTSAFETQKSCRIQRLFSLSKKDDVCQKALKQRS